MKTSRAVSPGALSPAALSAVVFFAVSGLGFLCIPSVSAQAHTVQVNALGFVPQELTVQVGDTVTWINSGGMHNVVADDAGFSSGPPSTDLWEYSHVLSEGGVYAYHCEQHPSETGTITVGGVFGDGFESGTADFWSRTEPPTLSNCDCYFSGDCVAPTGFCDWGTLTEEDTCIWRQNKPNGVPGAGCDVAYVGPWIAGICDGACSPSFQGSLLGWEDRDLIAEGAWLWAEALLRPAEAGGGPVDPMFAEEALALDFQSPNGAMALGRQVADLLAVAGTPAFAEHFCHYEGHPGDDDPSLYVDLSEDSCRREAARAGVEALLAELHQSGSGAKLIDGLRDSCADWREMFGPRCTGDSALACVERRIANLAVFLTTPRNSESYLQKIFGTWSE